MSFVSQSRALCSPLRSSGTAAAAAGMVLHIPTQRCLLQELSWLSPLRESRWLFFIFHTICSRRARRGRAGKPLLASGSTGKLWGVWMAAGCCRELYPEAAGQAVSQGWCHITALSGFRPGFRAQVTQTQCSCFNLGAGSTSGLSIPKSVQGWGSG